jgi:hypothetical protein
MIHIKELIRRLRGRMPVAAFDEVEPVPELRGFIDSLGRYRVTKSDLSSTRVLRLHERANWTDCDLRIMWFAGTLVLKLRERGFPFYVHTAYRSPALQRQLQAAGHSKVKSGPHQRGAAVDIVHCFYHWNVPADDPLWRYVGLLGEHIIRQNSLPIEWGGRFKSLFDPAHWQLKEWRQYPPIHDPTEVKLTPTAAVNFGSPFPPKRS